jgi:hypothetical protein
VTCAAADRLRSYGATRPHGAAATHPAPFPGAMVTTQPDREADRRQFRRNVIRVMAVQVITLLLLWLLQARFGT